MDSRVHGVAKSGTQLSDFHFTSSLHPSINQSQTVSDVSDCLRSYGLCVCESLSHVRFFAIPWTAARQAPLSLGFSRRECWSKLPSPPPGGLPGPGWDLSLLHLLLWQDGHNRAT